jgi:hypothetical protein
MGFKLENYSEFKFDIFYRLYFLFKFTFLAILNLVQNES